MSARPVVELLPRSDETQFGWETRLNRRIDTGDEAFDRTVQVVSEAPSEQVIEILDHFATRERILALMEMGCRRIGLHDEDAALTASIWVGTDETNIAEVADHLCRLHGLLPRFEGEPTRSSRLAVVVQVLFALPIPAGLILSHVMLKYWEPLSSQAYLLPGAVGIAAAVLLAPVAWVLSRGRPRGSDMFLRMAVSALIGLPVTSFGLASFANGVLDPHEPTVHRMRVVGKNVEDGVAELRESRQGDLTLQASTDEAWWQTVEAGDELTVTMGRGRFDWPWIADVRKAP